MTLTAKERKIFYHLVRCILKEKRPVGSKALAKVIKNKFSPPTLRIYLRKIAKAGYLEPEYCFSGRLPTEKGWHYYIFNYKLKPELKFKPEIKNQDIENFLEEISSLTNNIVFYNEKNFIIKGFKNIIKFSNNKILIEEILGLAEKIQDIVDSLDEKLNIFIGSRLSQFGGNQSSLIVYKSKEKTIGFLGPKINYYHTNLFLLKKLIDFKSNQK
jgi:transcriptional regulator of heat shock response